MAHKRRGTVSPPIFLIDESIGDAGGAGLGGVAGEDESKVAGQEDAPDTEAEVEPRRIARTPETPTASQRAEHADTHIPYRPWCDECVEAFGRERGHFAHDHLGGRRIPLVSMDYLFVTEKGVFSRSDAGADSDLATTLKVLVIYDSFSRAPFAIAVPRKGASEFVVKAVVAIVVWLGHSRVTVRTDNEPAIVAMIGEALKGLKVNLMDAAAEGSVPYDPQKNGAAESAVRMAKGMMIVHRRALEKRVQAKIPPTHPLMTWLVGHAVMLRLLCVRGSDGTTPYERLRGSPFRNEMYGLGEFVRFKCRSHEGRIPGSDDRWSTGLWLGIDLKTGQNILYDCGEPGEQIRHARTVMRLPDPQK